MRRLTPFLFLLVLCLPPSPVRLAPSVENGTGVTATATAAAPSVFVVLDPGHGGTDTGIVAVSLLKEKDLTLDLAELVAARLAEAGDVGTIMTRDEDVLTGSELRAAAVNRSRAKLLVSLHCGGSFSPQTNGFGVYCDAPVPGGEGTMEGLFSWQNAQASFIGESLKDAQVLNAALKDVFDKINAGKCPCPSFGVRQVPLLPLRGIALPAVLLEIGCLTNSQQAEYFSEESYRREIARALADAITEICLGRKP